MPPLKTHTRFLLRGSALLIGLLAFWWFVLSGPMLSALKDAAGSFVDIRDNASGERTVRVPIQAALEARGRPAPQYIHSVDFDIPRTGVNGFTFSLPVYWALILAAGWRRFLRPLLLGTALMCAFELVSLLLFCQITARGAIAQLAGNPDASGQWIRGSGHYLVVNALPFIVPILVALSLHPGLRGAIFPWGKPEMALPPSLGKKQRRRRRRVLGTTDAHG